jgi:acetyltransferase-like isoleucine patch superfamily enzyme
MIKRLFDALVYRLIIHCLGTKAYVKYLRKKGVAIGENIQIYNLDTINIDLTRPSLITIGENVAFNRNFTLLTHDYVSGVFIKAFSDILPSSGRVVIGNNVHTGQNVTILKGVTIGDNVFIGANSLVTRDIPSNSIAAGAPCKVIMSLEDYYKKRQVECVEEALELARSFYERYNRRPVVTDFREEYSLFVDASNVEEYPELNHLMRRQLGPSYDEYIINHKALYNGFDEFLHAAGIN